MSKKHKINLLSEQRQQLLEIVKKGSWRFRFLLKWLPVCAAGYLLVVFSSGSLWILAVITAIVTLAWIRWNLMRSIKQPSITPTKSFNWDSIQLFERSDSEHKKQAELIIKICENIIHWFGTKDETNQESKYQDEFVTIIFKDEGIKLGKAYHTMTLTVFFVSADEAVLKYEYSYYADERRYINTIHLFRPGSWIHHVSAFEGEVKQLENEARRKEQEARRKEQEARRKEQEAQILKKQLERQKKFGRID
jgi:hypothetical protein